MGAMGNFGISLGFPAGYVCEWFGGRVTSFVALVLTSFAFFMAYSTTQSKEWYASTTGAFLQDVYFFIGGKSNLVVF